MKYIVEELFYFVFKNLRDSNNTVTLKLIRTFLALDYKDLLNVMYKMVAKALNKPPLFCRLVFGTRSPNPMVVAVIAQ